MTSTASWTTSSATIATVSAGVVTPKAAGTATIMATSGGKSGQVTFTVSPATLVSLALTPKTPTIANGKTVQFTATGTYTDGTTQPIDPTLITWTSDTSTVADNPPNGLATAKALGTAIITALYTGGTAQDTATLTVTQTIYGYATNFGDNTVSQYELGTTGALTALATPTVATGVRPFSISVEPTGEYAYVANFGANTISQFKIGQDGTLSAIGTVATGVRPNGVTIDHSDQHAYVINYGDNTISQFTISTTGALVAMTTPTLPTGQNPASAVIDPLNRYAYVANFGSATTTAPTSGGTISQFLVNTNGSLTAMTTLTVDSQGGGPNSLIVDGTSKYVYAVNAGSNTVAQFTIGGDGTLALLATPVATGLRPFGLTVAAVGSTQYVYVANSIDSNGTTTLGSVSQFKVQSDGSLAAIGTGPVPAGYGASSVAVDPTGNYAYVTNRGTSSVSQYTINQTTGVLTPMTAPTATSGLNPAAIA